MAASGLRFLGRYLSVFPQKTVCGPPLNRGVNRWVRPTLMVLKKKQDKLEEVKPSHRNTYAEWNYNAEVFAFSKRLGEEFDDKLLKRALTQRSYIVMEEEKQRAVGIEDPKLALEDNSEFSEQGEKFMKNYIQRYLRTCLLYTSVIPRMLHFSREMRKSIKILKSSSLFDTGCIQRLFRLQFVIRTARKL